MPQAPFPSPKATPLDDVARIRILTDLRIRQIAPLVPARPFIGSSLREITYVTSPMFLPSCVAPSFAELPIMNDSLISMKFFEDAMTPPLYTELYGWTDGAQTDIFRSVPFGTDPNSTVTSSIAPTATSTSRSLPAATTSDSAGPTPSKSVSSQVLLDGIW